MHQIRERMGLRPRPRWGSSQRSPRPPSWIWLWSRRAPTENIWSNPPFQNPGYGPGTGLKLIESFHEHTWTVSCMSNQRPPDSQSRFHPREGTPGWEDLRRHCWVCRSKLGYRLKEANFKVRTSLQDQHQCKIGGSHTGHGSLALVMHCEAETSFGGRGISPWFVEGKYMYVIVLM